MVSPLRHTFINGRKGTERTGTRGAAMSLRVNDIVKDGEQNTAEDHLPRARAELATVRVQDLKHGLQRARSNLQVESHQPGMC